MCGAELGTGQGSIDGGSAPYLEASAWGQGACRFMGSKAWTSQSCRSVAKAAHVPHPVQGEEEGEARWHRMEVGGGTPGKRDGQK